MPTLAKNCVILRLFSHVRVRICPCCSSRGLPGPLRRLVLVLAPGRSPLRAPAPEPCGLSNRQVPAWSTGGARRTIQAPGRQTASRAISHVGGGRMGERPDPRDAPGAGRRETPPGSPTGQPAPSPTWSFPGPRSKAGAWEERGGRTFRGDLPYSWPPRRTSRFSIQKLSPSLKVYLDPR